MATSLSHDAMANAIRFLALDAVEKAKSGHPGLPMGAADVATVLWRDVLKFDASDPHWPDRDRFVLSAGHGCMLLYSPALSDRRRRRQRADDRRHQAVPAGRLEDAGASRILAAPRRRDDDRPARAGDRDRGRHGDRRADDGGALSRNRRPPHLCHRLRRRPDGGREPGGDRHRRPSQAQQAHRFLGQQRDLDRRHVPSSPTTSTRSPASSRLAGTRAISTATTPGDPRRRSTPRRIPTSRP